MDWFFKAVLTAGAVLLVMTAARQCGSRLAGVMAALPTVTAPALGWLAHEQGVGPAVSAAIASVAACAMLAAFALGYAVAARYAGPWIASLCGIAGATLMALPALAAGSDLMNALLLAGPACAFACLVMPRVRARCALVPCSTRHTAFVAATTGTLAAFAATLGPIFGSFATGLVASLPLIGGGGAAMAHVAGGRRAAVQFLSGYVRGLFAKIVFGAVFAVTAAPAGIGPGLLLACGCAALVATIRWPSWPDPSRGWTGTAVGTARR